MYYYTFQNCPRSLCSSFSLSTHLYYYAKNYKIDFLLIYQDSLWWLRLCIVSIFLLPVCILPISELPPPLNECDFNRQISLQREDSIWKMNLVKFQVIEDGIKRENSMYAYYCKCLDFKTTYQIRWSLASAPVRFQKRFLLYCFMYNISRSLETLPKVGVPMRMFQLFADNSNFFRAGDVRQNGFAFSHLPDYKPHTFRCRHIKREKHKLWKGKRTWFVSRDTVLRSETGLVATRALDLLQDLGSITCLLWTAWTSLSGHRLCLQSQGLEGLTGVSEMRPWQRPAPLR